MQADELRETSIRRGKVFPDIWAYLAAVPTYVGGFMTLGWAGKDAACRAVPVAEAMMACVLADHLLRDRGQTGGQRGRIG